jgi:ectoine hydroxylase-related dioxygenase (phytanoyl-CoA dioxygenase family)
MAALLGSETPPSEVADAFHRDGFVVLRDVLSEAFVRAARERAERNFAECRATIASKGLHFGLHAKNGFKEIVERNPGRFEVPYRMDEQLDNPFADRAELLDNPRLIAVMDAILGNNAPSSAAGEGKGGAKDQEEGAPSVSSSSSSSSSCNGSGGGGGDWSGGGMAEPTNNGWRLLGRSVVMSLPGAAEQQWHVDGAHVDVATHRPCHVLNVFFPLVDITPENGPTEVRPGSHYLSRDLAKMMLLAKLRKTLRAPLSPLVPAGSALVFDYRTLHRGRANTTASESRPVLVLTFAKSWFRDLYNFPKRSMMAAKEEQEQEQEQEGQEGAGGKLVEKGSGSGGQKEKEEEGPAVEETQTQTQTQTPTETRQQHRKEEGQQERQKQEAQEPETK